MIKSKEKGKIHLKIDNLTIGNKNITSTNGKEFELIEEMKCDIQL